MTPHPRPAARLLLLDPDDRLLLFLVENSAPNPDRYVWITPGGGLESGESYLDAAHRELWEEVGVRGVTVGECVWLRNHIWRFRGTQVESRERFYLARVPDDSVNPAGMEPEEKAVLQKWRWWSLAELQASDEVFAPRRLGALLAPLLAGVLPAAPFDVGK